MYGNLLHGCTSAGAHFNPFHLPHGGPDSKLRHVGDLGNVEAGEDGTAHLELNDHMVTLYGPNSIIGRSCVLHRDEDDVGTGKNTESLVTGNSGPRIACGLIGTVNF
jgi:Cu-Zn family superoxide dismutase